MYSNDFSSLDGLKTVNAVTASLSNEQLVESASSVEGPWQPIPNPWSRTNNAQIEVSVPASGTMRFFRLSLQP